MCVCVWGGGGGSNFFYYMLVMHASDSLTCKFYNVFYFMPVVHAFDSPTCTIFIIIILLVGFVKDKKNPFVYTGQKLQNDSGGR